MPPVTLGCDVGARYVGWAVLDDALLAHGVWDLHDTPEGWTPEAWLVSRVGRESWQGLRGTFQVALLAVEVFHWRKDKPIVPQAPTIQQHIGALLSLGTPGLAVRACTAAAWMKGIMGYLPRHRRLEHPAWKAAIRDQVGLMLGYPWPAHRRSAPTFGHASDAAGIGLYARSAYRLEAQIQASRRKDR